MEFPQIGGIGAFWPSRTVGSTPAAVNQSQPVVDPASQDLVAKRQDESSLLPDLKSLQAALLQSPPSSEAPQQPSEEKKADDEETRAKRQRAREELDYRMRNPDAEDHRDGYKFAPDPGTNKGNTKVRPGKKSLSVTHEFPEDPHKDWQIVKITASANNKGRFGVGITLDPNWGR